MDVVKAAINKRIELEYTLVGGDGGDGAASGGGGGGAADDDGEADD